MKRSNFLVVSGALMGVAALVLTRKAYFWSDTTQAVVLPPIGAALMMGMTIWIGRELFGRVTALGAGAICISCFAMIEAYGHVYVDTAMLYAALCMAIVALFLHAWRRHSRWASAGMWGAAGLAAAINGLLMPVTLLGSVTAVLLTHRLMIEAAKAARGETEDEPDRDASSGSGTIETTLRVMQPLIGMPLAAVIILTLWRYRPLDGSIWGYDLSWGAAMDFFYFYAPWILWLPWVLLWPLMVMHMFRQGAIDASSRLLGWILMVQMSVLSCLSPKPLEAALPMFGIGCVLAAFAARRASGWLWRRFGVRSRGWILGVHIAVAVGILLGWTQSILGVVVVTATAFAGCLMQKRCGWRSWQAIQNEWLIAAAMFVVVWIASGWGWPGR
ncbi:MAG: hypothetical protein GC162_06970 [Planctomycetes bacterium]|nr:hypothetical protein [Planctomycetota bacterium]